MRLEKYKLEVNPTKTTFEFISEGPKGRILKSVDYSKIRIKCFKNAYNFAFGDKKMNSEEIDDLVVTNNQDLEKVLATVVNTVVIFTKRRPKAHIFIVGSTPARIRLYQMVISKYIDELSELFDIKGFTPSKLLSYQKNINYLAFLITRKIN